MGENLWRGIEINLIELYEQEYHEKYHNGEF